MSTDQFNDLSLRTRWSAVERHAAARELVQAADALREAVQSNTATDADRRRHTAALEQWNEITGGAA